MKKAGRKAGVLPYHWQVETFETNMPNLQDISHCQISGLYSSTVNWIYFIYHCISYAQC